MRRRTKPTLCGEQFLDRSAVGFPAMVSLPTSRTSAVSDVAAADHGRHSGRPVMRGRMPQIDAACRVSFRDSCVDFRDFLIGGVLPGENPQPEITSTGFSVLRRLLKSALLKSRGLMRTCFLNCRWNVVELWKPTENATVVRDWSSLCIASMAF